MQNAARQSTRVNHVWSRITYISSFFSSTCVSWRDRFFPRENPGARSLYRSARFCSPRGVFSPPSGKKRREANATLFSAPGILGSLLFSTEVVPRGVEFVRARGFRWEFIRREEPSRFAVVGHASRATAAATVAARRPLGKRYGMFSRDISFAVPHKPEWLPSNAPRESARPRRRRDVRPRLTSDTLARKLTDGAFVRCMSHLRLSFPGGSLSLADETRTRNPLSTCIRRTEKKNNVCKRQKYRGEIQEIALNDRILGVSRERPSYMIFYIILYILYKLYKKISYIYI